MIPAIADITIKRIGDNFFFAKYLYPNIEATKSTVIMSDRTLTLMAKSVPKQFPIII